MFTGLKVWWWLRKLNSQSEHDRKVAAEALGKLGDARAVEPLIKELGLEDWPEKWNNTSYRWPINWSARSKAAWTLGELGDARAVDPLIKVLMGFGNYGKGEDSINSPSNVREAAAKALGKLGDERAVEPLIKALDDKYGVVRCAAVEALGKLGDKRAVEPLIKMLEDEYEDVRKAAAEILGNLGDVRAVEPLIKKTIGDGWGSVRQTAALLALGKLGEPKWQEIIKGDYSEADVARLKSCGDTRAVEILIKALGAARSDGDVHRYRGFEGLRRAAADALGELGDSRAVEPLIAEFYDLDNSDRVREALVKLGSCAVEPLIKRLWDKGYLPPLVKVLGRLGDARAVGPLCKMLENEEYYDNRLAAVKALGELGDTAVEPLIKALGDRNNEVRCAAAEALEKLGEPKWQEIVKGDDGDFDRLKACGDARVNR